MKTWYLIITLLIIVLMSMLTGQVNTSMFEDGSARIEFCYQACVIEDNNDVLYTSDNWAVFGNGFARWAGCVAPSMGCS